MPETLAAALVAQFGISTVAANFIAYAIVIAGSAAYANQQRRDAARKARAAYNASLKDRELTIRSAVANRVLIYGRDRVGGQMVYVQTTGAAKEFLHLVIKIADHECDAIEEVWFGDQKLPDPDANGFIQGGDFYARSEKDEAEVVTADAGGNATLSFAADRVLSATIPGGDSWEPGEHVGFSHTPGSNVVTGLPLGYNITVTYLRTSGRPLVRIRKHLGVATDPADAALISESGGKWTAQHLGFGLCYCYLRIEYDQDVFGQIGLPEIRFVVRGAKVFDPRTSTTAWQQNTALCVADYLKRADGMGAPAGTVPNSEVIAAANICDEAVQLTPGGATQKRYETNTTITTAQAPREALEDIVQDMAGRCVWTQGRWLIRPGAYRTPEPALGVDDLAGYLEVLPARGRDERFNAARVTYRDPSQKWAEVQAPLVTNALYESEDGVRLVRDFQFSSQMDAKRAQRLAKIELERSRQSLRFKAPFNLRAYDLAPTDTVPITLPRFGWNGKVFEVSDRVQHSQGRLEYTMQETAAGIYAWNFGEATTVDLAPDTTLPNPYERPPALTGFTAVSGTAHLLRAADGTLHARALLSWTAATSIFVLRGGSIEVQWKHGLSTVWQQVPSVPGDATRVHVGPLPSGQPIVFRVRPVNKLGRVGLWTAAVHVVIGKEQLPADVTGLTATRVANGVRIAWADISTVELDYAATELRVGASWAAGSFLFRGRAAEYTWLSPASGAYTVWAKHRDDSGNESGAAVSVAVSGEAASFEVDGQLQLVGNRGTKVGGGSAWNASARSRQGYLGGAVASAVAVSLADVGFGLNTDPALNANYTSIDYWLNLEADGDVVIFENGASVGLAGVTYVAGDRFTVHYDGANVRYYKNATAIRTVAANITLPLHFDSAFSSVGGELADMSFGPQSAVRNIGTDQLALGAATEVVIAVGSAISVTSNQTAPEWLGGRTDLVTLSFTPSITGDVLVTYSGGVTVSTSATGNAILFMTSMWINGTRDTTTSVAHADDRIGPSSSVRRQISFSKRVQVVAGTPYTVVLGAKRYDATNTVLIDYIEARAEIIKR